MPAIWSTGRLPAKRSSVNACSGRPEQRVVDERRVADDHAVALEPVDAPLDGGRRQRDALADVGERAPRVLAQQLHDLEVRRIELGVCSATQESYPNRDHSVDMLRRSIGQ